MTFDKSQITNLAQREAAFRLGEAYGEAAQAYWEAEDDDAIPALENAKDAAWEAYAAQDLRAELGCDDRPVRCVLTGIPILVGDEVMVDLSTDEYVLRAATGLKPRAKMREAAE